ncbi:MAG: portal protein [Cetobacterium sp.]|uniref:portal protein n=1 Tax=Cetobacterium sp. TaxID=2071632 RepID=UPI003EE79D25
MGIFDYKILKGTKTFQETALKVKKLDPSCIEELKELYRNGRKNADDVKSLYERVARMFFPNSNTFYSDGGVGLAGRDASSYLYDSTALLSGAGFVNFLKNTVIPAGSQFFSYEAKDKDLQGIADQWTKIVFDHIHNSNFDRVIHKYLENLTIGTGCLKVSGVDTGDGSSLVFKSFDLDRLGLDVDIHEYPNIVFYKHKNLTRFSINRGWGGDATLSFNEKIEEDRKNGKRDVVEFSIFLGTKNREGTAIGQYLYGLADEDFKHVYISKIMNYANIFAARFDTRAGTMPYGYAPPTNIITLVEELNKVMAMFFEGTEYSYKPPILGTSPEGSDEPNTINLQPGKVSWVSYGVTLQPVQCTFDSSGLLQEAERRRGTIREALMTEVIQGVSEAKYVTAEAVSLIQRQFINKFSGTWGSIQNEFVIKLAKACLEVLDEMNALPGRDKATLDTFEVTPKNPIAKQNEWAEVDKIVNDFQTTAGILGPELALEKFDIPKLVMKISEIIGTDKTVLKNNKQEIGQAVNETRQALLQMGGANADG